MADSGATSTATLELEHVMPLAVRDRAAAINAPAPVPGLVVDRVFDAERMASLQGREPEEMAGRLAAGHQAWVAMLDGNPAAWGWVATRTATMGELGATFSIAPTDRYLWNFVTLKQFRGRGIYPSLIHAIVESEVHAERFWIAWAPENYASGTGIRRAGFEPVAELSFDGAGRPAVFALVEGGGALASRVLGIPEVHETLAQCWRCVRAGRGGHHCRPRACRCDYQQPESPCHG